MMIDFPLVPIKLTLGRDKHPLPNGINLDGKDAAILCLGIALIFTTLALVSISVQR